MKQWEIGGPFKIGIAEKKDVTVPEGYVKLKVQLAGLHRYEYELYSGESGGSYPVVPGRCGVGIVSEAGENDYGLTRGTRVVIDPQLAPGSLMGRSEPGTLSDFVVIPCRNAFPVPAQVDDADLLFTEQISLAILTLNQMEFKKGAHVLIVGANVFGVIAAKLVMHYQGVPILLDTNEQCLKKATAAGVYYTINTAEQNPLQKLESITGGSPCGYAIFASRRLSALDSVDYLAVGARAAIVGWAHLSSVLSADVSLIMRRELHLYGVNNGGSHFPSAINVLANHVMAPSELIEDSVKFADCASVFNDPDAGLKNRGFIKVTF
ncbi:MAG: alcohol dehydrogenase catalytic domain-containing protein [Firmicutes bacterium]|nr:alcohol dehydrogenase catalytic domain-containing protein [Bacillota bacterium]